MLKDKVLVLRSIGFVASLILTFATYFIIVDQHFFNIKVNIAISIILIFAVMQAIFQFIFFLNVWREEEAHWNLGIFVSTLSIIFIIVFFSIWIMDHLDYNMMPK